MNIGKDILKHFGLKITPARLLILEVFSNDCKPINAEYVYEILKKKKIDPVTIYRTLNSFENKGIIRKVDLRKDSAYYEMSDHHHHHIVCTNCGYLEKFDSCLVEKISANAVGSNSKFKIINSHSFELFGICKNCTK